MNKLRDKFFKTSDFETERANARSWKVAAQRETAEENRQQPGRAQRWQQGLSAGQWKLKYLLQFGIYKVISKFSVLFNLLFLCRF